MNRRAALGWMVSLPILVAGCRSASRPTEGKHAAVLRYPLTMEPYTFNLARSNSTAVGELLRNIYEGPVTQNDRAEIVPCLADHWELSPDGRTVEPIPKRTRPLVLDVYDDQRREHEPNPVRAVRT